MKSAARNISLAMGLAPLLVWATPLTAQENAEPVIKNEMDFPADVEWKHAFDAYKAEAGEVNASLRRAFSFLEAMEENGVASVRVKIAVVVHGSSVFDVVSDTRYAAKYNADDMDSAVNPSAQIVAKLIERGAEIWVCGFAARYHGVGNADLLPGVKMAPTGTVAHADLQRRGFGINPY